MIYLKSRKLKEFGIFIIHNMRKSTFSAKNLKNLQLRNNLLRICKYMVNKIIINKNEKNFQ